MSRLGSISKYFGHLSDKRPFSFDGFDWVRFVIFGLQISLRQRLPPVQPPLCSGFRRICRGIIWGPHLVEKAAGASATGSTTRSTKASSRLESVLAIGGDPPRAGLPLGKRRKSPGLRCCLPQLISIVTVDHLMIVKLLHYRYQISRAFFRSLISTREGFPNLHGRTASARF